ncbi:MAG: DUF4416 family protein [Deferribacteraceae bacterium]|nr:DUF4416 family protein [Deferribacteraceae bacterium]
MALRQPNNVFYFTAVMYSSQLMTAPELSLRATHEIIAAIFPQLGLQSAVFAFDHTEYYTPEMGAGLKKYFIAFGAPAEPSRLPEYKHAALAAEAQYSKHNSRTINIDPGYLAEEKIVVASTKNFTHRIYLADGIFGDLQLMRQRGDYSAMPWTYADYVRPESIAFFEQLYSILHKS